MNGVSAFVQSDLAQANLNLDLMMMTIYIKIYIGAVCQWVFLFVTK